MKTIYLMSCVGLNFILCACEKSKTDLGKPEVRTVETNGSDYQTGRNPDLPAMDQEEANQLLKKHLDSEH